MTPGACAGASVVPPSSLPDGTYTMHVIASGVPEDLPSQVTFAGPRVASVAAPGPSPVQPTLATVTLNSPAPEGGTTVQLVTSNPQVASVPSTVIVPAGATSASFDITPGNAVGSTKLQAATANAPAFAASKVFGWSVTSIVGPSVTAPGTTATWTVGLDNAAPPSGAVVTLTSTNVALVTVPASVTVPAGQKRISFTATLGDPLAGTGRIYATLPGSAQSGFFGWYVRGLSGPTSASRNSAAAWTVSISGPAPAGGLVVGLWSSDSSVASLPSSVTIPAGQTTAPFPVNALEDPMNGTATVTATFGTSFVNASFQYAVTQAVSPTTIPTGGVATGTLSVTPAAPPEGLTFVLQSSNPRVATVPSRAMIPAGGTSATFSVAGIASGQSNILMTLGTWSSTQTISVATP